MRALDDEVCMGLLNVPVDYTGGSHRSMGIVPPSLNSGEMGGESGNDGYADYGEIIRRFSPAEFKTFVALSDTPAIFDAARQRDYTFGEERDHPLNRRQMLYLKYKYGVYFPWKVYFELMPNERWEDKSSGEGKAFCRDARRHFSRTIEFALSLPFSVIGCVKLLGLESNDHGTVHRDGEPEKFGADHFITLCPRANKRLFLWDEDERVSTEIGGHAYWFDDTNYHGVASDPFFRYSIRIDGVFTDEFLEQLEREHGAPLYAQK